MILPSGPPLKGFLSYFFLFYLPHLMVSKKQQLALAVVIVVFGMMLPGVQIAATFDPQRVRVLDQHGTSILIRGNAPLNRYGTFDPSLILDHVHNSIINKSNEIYYDTVYQKLIVISLVSSSQSDEKAVLEKERNYIILNDGHVQPKQQKIHHYQLLHRPVVGSWIPPLLPNHESNKLSSFINNWLWNSIYQPDDGAWELTNDIHELLHDSNTENTIIYIHCMRGIDRTGLVAGTYLARWVAGATKKEIHQINYNIAKRQLNFSARTALKWTLWKAERNRRE